MSLVEGLVHSYGDFNLNIPRWEIPDHGISALWGPSGSGKTTVFRILIGLEPCPGLKWTFDGVDLARLPSPDRRLGVVFQSLELFPHMSAEDNILFAARARRLPAAETGERLEMLVNSLRMGGFLRRKAAVLSGGEAQRVALARAIIGRPRLLLLDEPFSSLDMQLRQEARAMLKAVVLQFKLPALLITHDEADVRDLDAGKFEIRRLSASL
jgi:sulfate transport system ATP-binding protein/putative spermidine/putrescine transport system ATP-binding protein